MKDFVTLAILFCILVGIPMFFIGMFIEKTRRLMNFFKEEDMPESKWGDRLFWCGAAIFAVGLLLIFFVMPKL